jgi:YHS domain-containing protein
MAKDPICGMKVDERHAAGSSTNNGTTHYFCSTNCKNEFDKNPAKHAN